MDKDQAVNEPKRVSPVRATRTHPIIELELEDEYAIDPQDPPTRVPLVRATQTRPIIVLEMEDQFAIDSQKTAKSEGIPPIVPPDQTAPPRDVPKA